VALKECSISNRVDAWIAAIIQGEYHIAEAWKARGGGWASEVTEQGWKGFGNNLELARKNLSDAYESHPEFPESAARMVTVIMGNCSGADDERVWFDRAVAAQLDYTSAYMNLLLALKPRWGGSHKRMLGLARECLATKRFDTAVPSFYFLIAHEIGSEMDDWKEVYRQAGVYEDCVSATAGCIAAKTSSDEVRKFNSDMAIIAWATERYDDADRYLKEIGDSLHPKSLSAFGVSATEVAGKTRISVGPRGSEATDAETMAGRKQYDKAFAKYEAIAGDNSLDSATKSFAQGRMSDLRARSALERNDWVDLNYSQDMVGWQQKDGKWCMQTNGMLVGWREGTGWLRLVWDIQPGVNVEFTCDAEFGRGTTAEGVTILLAYGGTVPTCGVGLRFRQGQLFLYNNQKNQKVQFPCRFTSVNSLHVLLWDKKLTVSVNGIEVTNKYAIKEDWIGGDGLAFAEYYEGAGRHEVRIKNARIRRLKEDPEGF
jgi:tetratricopeptide (TPR) repeat protein